MRVYLTFSQIDRIETSGSFRVEAIENLLTRTPPIPNRIVECAKLPDVQTVVAEFVAAAEASGACGRVLTFDRSPRGVRACPGFKKLPSSTGGILVNEAVGIAAGRAVA